MALPTLRSQSPSDSIESDDSDLSNITLNEAQAMQTSGKVIADDPRLEPVPSLLKDMLEKAKALFTMSYTQFNGIRLDTQSIVFQELMFTDLRKSNARKAEDSV
jgi:hypothetical protein